MVNLTIRNIPDEIINKIKTLSHLEKRSLNNEILIILEKGLFNEINSRKNKKISKEAQVKLWEKLSGLWQDQRTTKQIIDDIYSQRSKGRDINL